MTEALHVVRFSLRDLWDEFVLLILLNILWSLTVALPIVPLFVLRSVDLIWMIAASLLLALPLPIVSGALCFVTNQIARGKTAGWRTLLIGIRRYWAKSLVVALINLVALVLLAANMQFYAAILQGPWRSIALGVWVVLGAYWLLIQVFWFPMILELESEKVFVALRSALAMAIITPGFSLTLALVLIVLGALCIALWVPAVLAMASLFMLIANHATRSRLAFSQKELYRPGVHQD
jgi:hypothetical protein